MRLLALLLAADMASLLCSASGVGTYQGHACLLIALLAAHGLIQRSIRPPELR